MVHLLGKKILNNNNNNYYYDYHWKYFQISSHSKHLIQNLPILFIQESWEAGEYINTSAWVINKLLTMLKGLSHLLENQGIVCCMVKQRHGLLASITIKLPFNINSPLAIWASWRKVNWAIWWLCRSLTNLPLDCFQTPRNVSCAACSIIEVFLK